MLDSSRRAIEALRALEEAWKASGQKSLDETIDLAEAKKLIAADMIGRHGHTDLGREEFKRLMGDLRKGEKVYLADNTIIRYNRHARTFRHWI